MLGCSLFVFICRPKIGVYTNGHLQAAKNYKKRENHWIGLRENLQEAMVFTIKLIGGSCKFSHHPIL
jgi:hypothetical protein